MEVGRAGLCRQTSAARRRAKEEGQCREELYPYSVVAREVDGSDCRSRCRFCAVCTSFSKSVAEADVSFEGDWPCDIPCAVRSLLTYIVLNVFPLPSGSSACPNPTRSLQCPVQVECGAVGAVSSASRQGGWVTGRHQPDERHVAESLKSRMIRAASGRDDARRTCGVLPRPSPPRLISSEYRPTCWRRGLLSQSQDKSFLAHMVSVA